MRIRTIKPEFYRSQDIANLSLENRLLFIGLWSYVDDNGVGVDDNRLIAADLFPLDEDQKAVRDYVREGLSTLSRHSLLTRYEVSGKRFVFIVNWDKHQRIDKPGKPRFPRPPEPLTSGNPPPSARPSGESPETLAPGTGEQRNRGRRTTPPPLRGDPPRAVALAPKRATRIPDDFAVTDAMVAWARENTPHVDGRLEFEQFRDYWHAKSGKDATKIDWVATWRNWMRKAEQDCGRRNGARLATTDQRVLQIQALKSKFRNEPNELPWGDAS